MTNQNDSFIREVNEELRSDQMRAVWTQYGLIVVAIAVAIVIGTAGYRGYVYWSGKQASASGDKFLTAMKLASDNKTDEALAAFAQLEKDGYGSYPVLARMRAASLKAATDPKAAVVELDAVANDKTVPDAVRDVARLRAGWLLIDTAPYADVSKEVEVLTDAQNPMRHSAREALGLSAYKNGDFKQAKDWFQLIANDQQTPVNVANRARIMLDLLTANTKG
ncbi:tetratricopeptide repeat protein [Rhizobium sp. C1]|uniref:tetratricopeptide repeat protein n=1 Tax=Rhizobium sp. C1 TaxID=1349799 RepID=UPI001E4CA633|nr:tetratricopeptide repeat protein [Rhizobium sp. C1]MCD2180137.1 tetratricopeptide repeat protein [Rhizobium sp. C1]